MVRRILGGVVQRIKNIRPNINVKIKKSNWYHGQFPHLSEYERLKQGADIICLGSTPAKNALDFKGLKNIKGYNLAVCPETIFYDFQVLKNYHSFLKQGGTVLFVLCPFTFLKDYYRDEYGSTSYLNIRYYPILHRAMIDTFDYKLYHKWVEEPLLIGMQAWKCLIKDWPVSKTMSIRSNFQTPEESQEACKMRIKNWMREFHMIDLDPTHIPEETEKAIKANIEIFKNIKEFIKDRGYKALIIVPPFPSEMTSLLPKELVEHTLYEPIKAAGIPYISYFGQIKWFPREFYYHGFLLNAKGRELLTKDILSRIKL